MLVTLTHPAPYVYWLGAIRRPLPGLCPIRRRAGERYADQAFARARAGWPRSAAREQPRGYGPVSTSRCTTLSRRLLRPGLSRAARHSSPVHAWLTRLV